MRVYETSHIKLPRHRATKAEVEERREALLAIIDEMRPIKMRQVFYQATVRGLVEKAESGYAKVQTDLTLMRSIRCPALRLACGQHSVAAQTEDLQQWCCPRLTGHPAR
jgi:hypothetical protein